jgi:hypothetical protein
MQSNENFSCDIHGGRYVQRKAVAGSIVLDDIRGVSGYHDVCTKCSSLVREFIEELMVKNGRIPKITANELATRSR